MAPVTKSDRPQISIPPRLLDYVLEILAACGLIAIFGLAMLHLYQMPSQVPMHFGTAGSPEGYGSKISLWVLPLAGLALYIFMTVVNRRPERFDYLISITPENARSQYTLVTRVIRILKAFVMGLFTLLVWQCIGMAEGSAIRPGTWLLPVVMVATLGTTFFYILKSTAEK